MKKYIAVLVLVLILFCLPGMASGGNSVEVWNTQKKGALSPINLTIGYTSFLEKGDNDFVNNYKMDANLSRAQIEKSLRHFAVGVYEMTNGAHHLGRIKIVDFGNNLPAEKLHIKWQRASPGANTSAGNYRPYRQHAPYDVLVTNTFIKYKKIKNAAGQSDYIMRNSEEWGRYGGYVLAHEMGHYIYGLWDEYPLKDMTGLPDARAKTIMGEQFKIFEEQDNIEKVKWLNFSTEYNYKDGMATQQYQFFGASAWEALTQAIPSKNSDGDYTKHVYEDLKAVRPKGQNLDSPEGWYSIQYKNGPPAENASSFSPSSGSFKPPIIEWGKPKRVKIVLWDTTSGVYPPIENLFYGDGKPVEGYWSTFLNVMWQGYDQVAALPGKGMEAHFGVFGFGEKTEEVLPIGIITAENKAKKKNDLLKKGIALDKAIAKTQKNPERKVYETLLEILSDSGQFSLPQYLSSTEGCILADIVVVASGKDTSAPGTLERVIQKSRELFIPIHTFVIGPEDSSNAGYEKLALRTGGKYSAGIIPLSPQKVTWYGDTPYRLFQGSTPSYDPWKAIAFIKMKELIKRNRESGIGRSIPEPRAVPPLGGNLTKAHVNPSPASESSKKDENGVLFDIKVSPYVALHTAPYAASYRAEASSYIALNSGMRRDSGEDSMLFYVDKTMRVLNFSGRTNAYNIDVGFTLTTPSGQVYPVVFESATDSGWGTIWTATVELEEPLPGHWKLEMSNNMQSRDAFVLMRITGDAGSIHDAIILDLDVENAYMGVLNSVHHGDTARVTATVRHEGEYFTDYAINATVEHPSGQISTLILRDDGVAPDLMAKDGTYTANVVCDNPGSYIVKCTVSNGGGMARPTRYLAMRDVSFDLDGPSPFLGDPLGFHFERTEGAQFSVISDSDREQTSFYYYEQGNPDYYMNLGSIRGPQTILLGIDTEYSADISLSSGALNRYISWSVPTNSGAVITADPQGHPGVVKVRIDSATYSQPLSIQSRVPQALGGLIEAQKKTLNIATASPFFEGDTFLSQAPISVFENEVVRFGGALWLPDGYPKKTTWSTSGSNVVAQLVAQDESGCTVKTLAPGKFSLQLASDAYPNQIKRSVEVKVIPRESSGPNHPEDPDDGAGSGPNPGPGDKDPGGDDSVSTDVDGNGNSGDVDGSDQSGGGKNPDVPETPEPTPLPPGVSKITLNGKPLNASTSLIGLEPVLLTFYFDSPINRHALSSALLSGVESSSKEESIISNIILSEDGMKLTAEFLPKIEGRHKLFYSFEKKDGIAVVGNFILQVARGGGGTLSSDTGSSGGGCDAVGVGALWILFLAAIVCCSFKKWSDVHSTSMFHI